MTANSAWLCSMLWLCQGFFLPPLSAILLPLFLLRMGQAVVLPQRVYWPLLASTCSPFKAQPRWPNRNKLSLSARRGEREIFIWEFTVLQMAIHGCSKTGMVKPAGHERGNFIRSCLLLQLESRKMWWAFVFLRMSVWMLHVLCLCSGIKSDYWTHTCGCDWNGNEQFMFEEHWLSR